MTADLYAAAREALARAMFTAWPGWIDEAGGTLAAQEEMAAESEALLAALDAPARAALLAWLLPGLSGLRDRLTTARNRPVRTGTMEEYRTFVEIGDIADQVLAALTDPATDGGR